MTGYSPTSVRRLLMPKSRTDILHHVDELLSELDGMVFDLEKNEQHWEKADPEKRRLFGYRKPTKTAVVQAQKKCNAIYRALKSYEVRL